MDKPFIFESTNYGAYVSRQCREVWVNVYAPLGDYPVSYGAERSSREKAKDMASVRLTMLYRIKVTFKGRWSGVSNG